MFIALVLLNITHPGRVMVGKESDFPSRKERKNMVFPRDLGHPMTVLPTNEPGAAVPQRYP